MSRARELARLANANAISVDTSNYVGIGTSTSLQYKLDVVGDANFTGVLTATSFGGDGSNLTGVAATDNINTNNIKVSGISTLGTATADSIVVGSAVTVNGSGIKAGIITANSFSGDGSSLTGVAATDYVVANTLKVLGVSTFVGNTQLTATTASTSSATGALVVSGGVGIAGSLHVGENVSVGGTLTYEDVTNIDSVGVVTARLGVKVLAGGINAVGVVTATTIHVGSATTIDGSGINVTGVITATSYKGDGSALTGVAATDNINTNNIAISGIATVGTSITMRDGAINVTGIVTATGLDAGISVWILGADGTSHYTFSGPGLTGAENDPTLYLQRGQKYVFRNRSGGHPFRIQSTVNGSSGTSYSDGVTNNDAANGTDLVWNVQQDAPDVLYYQCTSHANMGGVIYIGNRFQSFQEPYDFWMFGG